MPEPDFFALADRLHRSGVAPRYVRRTVDELETHYRDLLQDSVSDARSAEAAVQVAADRLGDLEVIARQVAARPELKCWYFRWPAVARLALPVACVAALPLSPLVAGVHHRTEVMRWGFCLLTSALFTSLLFGVLQLFIRLS